jgi:NADH-quinone oxidoreductase subunit E
MSEPVLELLLWILLTFFVGCILGCILKMVFGRRSSVATSAGATMPASAPSPSAVSASPPKPKANKKPARPALANAAKPAAKVESTSPAIAPAAKGEQPKGIPTPRAGQPDKLQRISGIGPKIERTLHALGIFHFDQVAHWTEDQILWVEDHLKFKGRIARENWIGQSRLLADGNEAEFARLYGTEAAGADKAGKTTPPPKRRATKAAKPTSAP